MEDETRGRPTNSARIKELEREMEELKGALIQERSQKESLGLLAGIQTGTTMVPVKNFSEQNVGLSFVYQGRKVETVLEPKGMSQTTTVPLDYWNELEKNALVTTGLIARTDIPVTNPNIIVDRETFLDGLHESEIKDRIDQIVRPGRLRSLIDFYELVSKEDRTIKHKLMLDALRERVFEVSGVRVLETDEDAGF